MENPTKPTFLSEDQVKEFDKQASHADIFGSAPIGSPGSHFKIGSHDKRQPDMFSPFIHMIPQNYGFYAPYPKVF